MLHDRSARQCHLLEYLAVAFGMPVGGKENVHKVGKLKLSSMIVCLSCLLMATIYYSKSQVMRDSLRHNSERARVYDGGGERVSGFDIQMLIRSRASSLARMN